MRCPACQASVSAEDRFCPRCGKALNSDAQAAVADPGAGRGDRSDAAPARKGASSSGAVRDEPERELWHGAYSPYAMLGTWILAAIMGVGALITAAVWSSDSGTGAGLMVGFTVAVVVWVYALVLYLYRRWSVRYRLTNWRLFHEIGILRRMTNRIELIDVRDISFVQGIVDRTVGVGSIVVLSSDESHPRLVMTGIADVKRVVDLFESTRKDIRQRRVSYVERV